VHPVILTQETIVENEKGKADFPRAMRPPEGAVKRINAALMEQAIEVSRRSPRRRVILPLHKSNDDCYQRMLNVMQPRSYVCPHRHKTPPKSESVVVLQGAIGFVTFSDTGEVEGRYVLAADSPEVGVDIEPGIYHTFFALQDDTVVFEAKTGPYDPSSDKGFAPWAPPEGSPDAQGYLEKLYEMI
jgi:cupin fold WbuC family metalloprotein